MSNRNPNMHQVHFWIPLEQHRELGKILTEKGMRSQLLRRFVSKYINYIKDAKLGVDPIDKAVKELVKDKIEKGEI